MSSLSQWLAKIEAGHHTEIDMGLSRVHEVAKRLGLRFDNAVVITVAGTNGKGTTCRLIESVCQNSGLRTGVYSSPHILKFNERIRIEQQVVSDETICNAFDAVEQVKAEISLSYFEYATLAALLAFKQAHLEVIILEVGLGGRLDATNIIDADISVLTSIGLDHQDYLGDSLEQIALEKAGIVKPQKRSVVGFSERFKDAELFIEQQENRVLRRDTDFFLDDTQNASGENAFVGRVRFNNTDYPYKWRVSHIPAQNVMTAIAALWWLSDLLTGNGRKKLLENLSDSNKLNAIIEDTHLAGRAQVVCTSPIILLDVAHNKDSADYLVNKISTFQYDNCRMVVGMLKDKNVEQTLASLGNVKAHWYCASLPPKRGEQASRLVDSVPSYSALSVNAFVSIEQALSQAIEESSFTDMIVVVGSFITVAEATQHLSENLVKNLAKKTDN